jgi:AcrR family transcriptional regulator
MMDTKTRILEAAEKLIVQYGPEKATLRRITAEAGVNLAAINYHFGSKANLENAILARFLDPFEVRRIQLLEAAEKQAGDRGPTLERVIRCYLTPLLEFSDRYPDHDRIFAGLYKMFDDDTRFKDQIQKMLQHTFQCYTETLFQILPDMPRETVIVRLTFMWSTAHALIDSWLTGSFLTDSGLSVTDAGYLDHLVAFIAAGFRAPLRIGSEIN